MAEIKNSYEKAKNEIKELRASRSRALDEVAALKQRHEEAENKADRAVRGADEAGREFNRLRSEMEALRKANQDLRVPIFAIL